MEQENRPGEFRGWSGIQELINGVIDLINGVIFKRFLNTYFNLPDFESGFPQILSRGSGLPCVALFQHSISCLDSSHVLLLIALNVATVNSTQFRFLVKTDSD